MTEFEFHPLTPERWADFERLFGQRGAYGGCWCMFWRLKRAEFERNQGAGNKAALREIVESGQAPGILAYHEGEAVGWCSVAPREDFGALERSTRLKRLDATPVWSIVCFYVDRRHRGQGLMIELIKAAVAYVREQGGQMVEAYPVEPAGRELAPVSSYMGVVDAFWHAGFVEVARPTEKRAIMRYTIA